MAKKEMKILRHERRVASATKIQATWRGYAAHDDFIHVISDIILAQSVVRRCIASRAIHQIREERQIYCATRIQAVWRGCRASNSFIRAISDIILAQSVVRRCIASRAVHQIREERQMYCATRIQAVWRGFRASNSFIHAISDIILVQSVARRCQAIKMVRQLMEERCILMNKSATKIGATWRRFYAAREYKFTLAGKLQFSLVTIIMILLLTIFLTADIILAQSLARRLSSTRLRRRLTIEHDERRESSSTKITSNWRRYSASRAYKCNVAGKLIFCKSG